MSYPAMSKPLILAPNHMPLAKFVSSRAIGTVNETSDFTELLHTFGVIAKTISSVLRCGNLFHPFTITDKSKDPKKIQTLAYDVVVNLLTYSGVVGIMITGDSNGVLEVERENKGKYIVTFDCLEGLSNVDVAINVGTIFSILVKHDGSLPGVKDAINPNNIMLAAGYALYGSATIFVFSTGNGVSEFILDPQTGEFLLSEKEISITRESYIYTLNEARMSLWDDSLKEFVREKKFTDKKKQYTSRYVGSLVADIHRTIKHGGICLYPPDKDLRNGKLNLLCNCRPMAFVMTDAGGWASNGQIFIKDVAVKDINQNSPLFIGDPTEVEELVDFITKHNREKNKGAIRV